MYVCHLVIINCCVEAYIILGVMSGTSGKKSGGGVAGGSAHATLGIGIDFVPPGPMITPSKRRPTGSSNTPNKKNRGQLEGARRDPKVQRQETPVPSNPQVQHQETPVPSNPQVQHQETPVPSNPQMQRQETPVPYNPQMQRQETPVPSNPNIQHLETLPPLPDADPPPTLAYF